MSLFGFLLVPKSLLTSIDAWMQAVDAKLARIDATQRRHGEKLDALNAQGVNVMHEVEDLKAAVGELKTQVARATSELHDLAGKIENTTDPAELAAIAAEIRTITGGLKSTVDTVDTDGSSAAATDSPAEG